MQPKAQTLQQRFGFQDPELATPKHDELMLWLDNWVTNTLPGLLSWQEVEVWDWDNRSIVNSTNGETQAGWIGWWTTRINGLLHGTKHKKKLTISEFKEEYGTMDLPSIPTGKIGKKLWEMPILDKNYTIGFIDMGVLLYKPSLDYHVTESVLQVSPENHWVEERLYFEVKPTIPSVGELIRQVRMYQSYAVNGKWFIVSPDDRWGETLLNQGIYTIKVT